MKLPPLDGEDFNRGRFSNSVDAYSIEKRIPDTKFSDIVSNIAIIQDGTIEFATNTDDFWDVWLKKCPLLYFDTFTNTFQLCTPKHTDFDKKWNRVPEKGDNNYYDISTVLIYVTNISRMVATVSSLIPWNKKPGGKTFRKKRSRYHKQRKHYPVLPIIFFQYSIRINARLCSVLECRCAYRVKKSPSSLCLRTRS